MGKPWQKILTLLCLTAATLAHGSPSQVSSKIAKAPLSVEAAMHISTYTDVDLSPDGTWLAYQFADASGIPTRRLRLMNLASGETIDLAPPGIATHRPTWSPDSRQLAFYSEESGKPMLWVWSRDSGQIRMIPEAEFSDSPRSGIRWFPDNRRVLIPMRSENGKSAKVETIVERLKAVQPFRPPFKSVKPGEPSVYVHRANFGAEEAIESNAATDTDVMRRLYPPCDLGIVDVQTGEVRRIARSEVLLRFQEPSPDGRWVAYVVWVRRTQDTQLDLYDLHLIDLKTNTHRVAAQGLANLIGNGMAWSPDSRSIAHLELRAQHAGDGSRHRANPADLWVIPVEAGAVRRLNGADLPAFDGRVRPVWDEASKRLYASGVDGTLWQVSTETGAGGSVASFGSRRIGAIVRPNERPVLWTQRSGQQILVTLKQPLDGTTGLFAVDLQSGALTGLVERSETMPQDVYVDASAATGTVALITASQQDPSALWLWRAGQKAPRHIPTLNPELEPTQLARSRRLTWRTQEGRELAGTLLVPPDYRPGQKRPLFVWVYGGRMASEQMHQFGFTTVASYSAFINMQMLASRGYLVLAPDIPQRLGTPMQDIVAAVMPAVDAAIAEGLADPERLAVSGHSYGSYTTLTLITHTNRFKAAIISAVGDPDLVTDYLQMKPNGNSSYFWAESGQGLMGGTPWQYPERYRDNSPLFLFDRIETPLLIGQGEVDTTTDITGANAVFAALRRLGRPVEYRIYEGEGHVFYTPANIVDFWNRRFSFLAEHLDIALDETGRILMAKDGRARSQNVEMKVKQLH